MYTAFETLQSMGSCGVVWIYFSGHGLPSAAGALARKAVQGLEVKAGRHRLGLQMEGGFLQMEAGGQILQSHLLQLASQLPGAQTLMVSATLCWSSLLCWLQVLDCCGLRPMPLGRSKGTVREWCASHEVCTELYSRPTNVLRVYRMARPADM